MKKIIVILGIVMVMVTSVWGSEKITIRRERTPDREYFQKNSSGNLEKVKEYRDGTTVKEGFRYESGKGIIKYNEAVPKTKEKRK